MTPKEIATNRNTPGWVSAIAAVVVGAIAVWSLASTPSEDTLGDHEQRLRTTEHIIAERLSSIDQRLETLGEEVRRLRDARAAAR